MSKKTKTDNKSERTLYCTSGCGDNYTYEMYKEFCEINEIDPEPEGSTAYWEWVSEESAEDYENLFANMSYSKADKENRHYAITFDLGLWDGHRIGYVEKTFDTLSSAIRYSAESSRDYNDVKVTYENGRVYVYGYHHDGTNKMEIRLLSARGKRALVDTQKPDWDKAVNNEKNFKILKYNDL